MVLTPDAAKAMPDPSKPLGGVRSHGSRASVRSHKRKTAFRAAVCSVDAAKVLAVLGSSFVVPRKMEVLLSTDSWPHHQQTLQPFAFQRATPALAPTRAGDKSSGHSSLPARSSTNPPIQARTIKAPTIQAIDLRVGSGFEGCRLRSLPVGRRVWDVAI